MLASRTVPAGAVKDLVPAALSDGVPRFLQSDVGVMSVTSHTFMENVPALVVVTSTLLSQYPPGFEPVMNLCNFCALVTDEAGASA